MTKERYKELKAEIKDLTTAIRVGKTDRKKCEQDYTKFQQFQWMHRSGKISQDEWLEIKKEYPNAYFMMTSKRHDVDEMAQEFRWRHVLLSLARGKMMNQIEQKHSDDYWKNRQTLTMLNRVRKENEKYDIENFDALFGSYTDDM